jgi:hypothetical protein
MVFQSIGVPSLNSASSLKVKVRTVLPSTSSTVRSAMYDGLGVTVPSGADRRIWGLYQVHSVEPSTTLSWWRAFDCGGISPIAVT